MNINTGARACFVIFIVALFLTACGGGGGGSDDTPDPAKGSKWDQMKWDQGKWG